MDDVTGPPKDTRMSLRTCARRWLVLGVVLMPLTACATNPVTGRSELSLVSESQEIAMGRSYAAQIVQEMGAYPDSQVQAYVSRLGLQLAAGSERPRLPWTFTVMDDPVVNAFALPGGYIFITRGIMSHMNSEAELVSVVGHEIGHVTAKHSVRQMSKQQLAQVGLVAGAIASSRIAQNLGALSQGLGLLFLKWGRDDETQADALGFRYTYRNGYDVREMVHVFQTLQRVSNRGGGGRIPEYLSTHPDPGNRIKKTEFRIDSLHADLSGARDNREEYLGAIDGMVYGDNPRQGFFEGSVFFHPDLAFRLDFPSGWRTQNQPQAVVGVSQQQDAMVQLGLAGSTAPAEAARKFLGQQGVQGGPAVETRINGNPAVSVRFSAQLEDGSALAGDVAWVSYGGATYRLLGYSKEAAYRTYQGTFRQFLGSFRRLTDPAALNVKPRRIAITQVPRAMTLEDFSRHYSSVVELDELALINGMEPTSPLSAGQRVKRVVQGQ